ncbi:MAG: dihydroorotate dehydrogenase [Clostridia bacterium]|nr:dihydroorotate dehydrogenase [Clostridia bacterium]
MTAACDLSVSLGPLRLANPVVLASGTAGYGRELGAALPLSALGAIVVKGVAPEPWPGNPGPRVVETPAGLVNSIGLENPGLDHFLAHDLPWLRSVGATVIVNVVGRTADDYVKVAGRLAAEPGVAALELNVSCPNVEAGCEFGHDPKLAAGLVARVKEANPAPLFVKLSPNAPDPLAVAEAVLGAGADGLTLMNTYLALAIDVRRRRPLLPGVTGGLSGPAVKPLTLRWIWEAAERFRAPIIGTGGAATVEDVVEFLLAGASAVGIGSATFARPDAAWRIAEALPEALARLGFATAAEAVGAAHGRGAGAGIPRG